MKVFAILLFLGICSTVGRSQEKLTPDLWKRIDVESPKSLPQQPVVKRATSDAYDDGLVGKVKRVISEYRSYADVCADRGRFLSNIDEYDRNGDQVRNVSFANCGELIGIQVYGYFKGFRASLYKSVPPRAGKFTIFGGDVVRAKPNPATHAPDERYTYKYEYSYADGRLSEMRMFHNDGRRGMYYKYTTSPTERSTSGFTEDGELNWQTVYKLDEKGNEVEQVNMDVRKVYGHDTVYLIRTKVFDAAGNWIERSTYELKAHGATSREMLVSEQFRTITYY